MRARRLIAATASVAIAAAALTASAGAVPGPSDSAGGLLELSLADALEIGQVDPPPPGVGLLVRAHFPKDEPLEIDGRHVHALAVDISPDGSLVTRDSQAGSSFSSMAVGKCDDPTFVPMGVRWAAEDMPIGWKFNNRRLPPRVIQIRTVRALRGAHDAWPDLFSPCNGERNSFSFRFDGFSRAGIGYDGINNVDFGRLGSRALAVSYTWYRGSRILEVDLRFNRFGYPWTNRRDRPTRYLIRNVATHEIGHQLGLDDLGHPHRHQTMYGRISSGEARKIRLGRGDMRGARVLSP
jgi:hypothetical protein